MIDSRRFRLILRASTLVALCVVAGALLSADPYCDASYGDAQAACSAQFSACQTSPNALIQGYCDSQQAQCNAAAQNNYLMCQASNPSGGGGTPPTQCPDENYCSSGYAACIVSTGGGPGCDAQYASCEACNYVY